MIVLLSGENLSVTVRDTDMFDGVKRYYLIDYNERKEFLREKLNCLGDNDFYITAYLIHRNRYDVTKVMEAAGMASLNK